MLYDKGFHKLQIIDPSKLKRFVDDKFKFDKNDRKSSDRVENNVGKGEIANYKKILPFPQSLQKNLLLTCRNKELFGKA